MHEHETGKPPAGPAADGLNEEARLQRESEDLRRHWSTLPAEEPPALLDQAVRNAARRALGPALPPRRRLRWLGGLATAMVAVLALSLLLLQPESGPAPEVDGFQLQQARPAAPAAAADEDRRERRLAPATAAAKTEAVPSVESMAADAAAAPAADVAPPALNEAARFADTPEAEEWIRQLLELQAAGKSGQLAVELARFRAAYPDHPLPESLSAPPAE